MSLTEYQRKRDFHATSEPKGGRMPREGWLYVIQKHAASHLHYDFRLQLGGVLKSWAVPKGPSLNPSMKRLAVHVEDHPVEYGGFEGIIPQGQYGGGTVMLWDRGDWSPAENPEDGYKKGRLKFTLNGSKLRGGWMLIRKGGARDTSEKNWFLIKERDDEASDEQEIVETATRSVLTDRTLDEIAAAKDREWGSTATADEGKTSPRLPKSIAPQLATLVDEPPEGGDWLHEIKFDGYRMICRIENGSVQFLSRNQQDWTQKLEALAKTLESLPVQDAILDGEVVAMDSSGVSRFQLLQNAFRDGQSGTLHYYIFDLLHLNSKDLTRVPLEKRKELLTELFSGVKGLRQIHLSEHVVGNGPHFFEQARKLKLEGIISKRRVSVYSKGRSHDWLKTKCFSREEFVIGGYTDPEGARSAFGALLLGYHKVGSQLAYAGKVGTGFSAKTLSSLIEKLRPLALDRSPFADFPKSRGSTRNLHWVNPELVAQIEFSNWTDDGKLRHPAFLGLREDKPAADVVRDAPEDPEKLAKSKTADRGGIRRSGERVKSEKKSPHPGPLPAKPGRGGRGIPSRERQSDPQPVVPRALKSPHPAKPGRGGHALTTASAEELEAHLGVHLTHPDKVLYSDEKITKLDMARYYASVEKWILPQIENRLVVLVRCPEGAAKECFYQKHPGRGTPESLRQVTVREKNSSGNYLVIEDLTGLVWLAQVGALELHVWGSRADDLERPDRLVFDLDPDPSVDWGRVVESAFQIRQFLRDLGLESFLKTTGGKGLHLVVPIQRRSTWDEVKSFCHAVARSIEAADPARYVSKMTKVARHGKIYIDYLRNQRGATAVAAYSTRARAGATVSVPVEWEELKKGLRSDQFNVINLPVRLSALKKDPWREIATIRQSITAAAKKAVGM